MCDSELSNERASLPGRPGVGHHAGAIPTSGGGSEFRIGEVTFSTRGSREAEAWQPSRVFEPDVSKVFAFFPVPVHDASDELVIVKWVDLSERRVLSLRQERIPAGESICRVWLEPPSGWRSGHYQLSVFSVDDAAAVLAVGEFSVRQRRAGP